MTTQLSVIKIIVSTMTSHCTDTVVTVQMREESENRIRK